MKVSQIFKKIQILPIFFLGLFLRLYNLNWDSNSHLHPDERFLTMVGNSMKMPQSFFDYLNPAISTFNPSNIGFDFFVYGIFPLTINKILSLFLWTDSYNLFTIQGRALSAIADSLIILLIFFTVKLLEENLKLDKRVKYFSAFIYAVMVLPIQLSHFFTVDTFLNVFVFTSIFFALKNKIKENIYSICLSGLFFGLAIASKVSAIYVFPLIFALLISNSKNLNGTIIRTSKYIILFGLFSYITLKISNPYIFASGNIFNPFPNPEFLTSINILNSFSAENSYFPPNVQWINKLPIIFPLSNLILFGLGIPIFITFLIGCYHLVRKNVKSLAIPILGWIILFFLYQGIQAVTTMRYFFFTYPLIAIISGLGLYKVIYSRSMIFKIIIILILVLWPLAFMSIYTKPHTRVEATKWISKNIPLNSVILSEHWDDSLPLTDWENYEIIQLPVFDEESEEKWNTINEALNKGDYIILSSNRGWGSIPTVPSRYPKTTKYYDDLLNEKTSYKKIKEFTSYPSFNYLGVPLEISDDNAEEAFHVYDHPKVMIFKNTKK